MVLSAAAQTAIAKSRLLKLRKIQQLQLQSGFLLSLSGAVATTWWSAQLGYPSTELLGELLQVSCNTDAVYWGRAIAADKLAGLVESRYCAL